MLRPSTPTSSASAAPAAVTAAGVSPALGTGERSGEEGQGEGEDLLEGLGVGVVARALDDGEPSEALGQVGEDALALGARVDPVGVGAALDDEDGAGDVRQLRAGV